MADWIKVNLGELAAEGRSVISGPFGSDIGTQFFKSEGVPVIRGNNLTKDHRRLVDDGFVFVTEDKADDLDAYAVEDDLIFTAAGTIGQVGLIPEGSRFEKYVISNKQIRFRADLSKVDLDYLYAWLSSPWIFRAIENRDTGSTVPLINLSVVRSLPVSLPKSGAEQRKIGRIFRALDAKIDLNNRINAELEALTKAIYDYWFVQFDFPDAEGRPYKTSGGRMVWNDTMKREVPAKWDVGRLDDALRLEYGKPLKDSERSGGGFPVLGSNGVVGRHCNYLVTGPGIVVGRKGTVGAITYVHQNFSPIDTTYYVAPKNGFGFSFLHQLLRTLPLARLNSDSAVPGLNRESAHRLPVVLPAKKVADEFECVLASLVGRMRRGDEENFELTRLRDWLLPLLMNGQVRVA